MGNERHAAWFHRSEYSAILNKNEKNICHIGNHGKMKQKNKSKKKKKKKIGSRNSSNSICDTFRLRRNKIGNDLHDRYQQQECRLHDVDVENEDDLEEEGGHGYSIRALERETSLEKKRRDEICFEAKFTVLSLQKGLRAHIQAVQKKKNNNNNKNNEKKKKNTSNQVVDCEHKDNVNEKRNIDTNDGNTDAAVTTATAQQYRECYRLVIAQRYNEICKRHAKDARERGLQDERIAHNILLSVPQQPQELDGSNNTINNLNSSSSNSGSNNNKIFIDCDVERRPSTINTTSNDATTECSDFHDDDDNDEDNNTMCSL